MFFCGYNFSILLHMILTFIAADSIILYPIPIFIMLLQWLESLLFAANVDQLPRVVSAIKQIYSLNKRLKVKNVFAILQIQSLTRKAGGVIGPASLISLLVSRDGRWLRDDCLVAARALAFLSQKYKAWFNELYAPKYSVEKQIFESQWKLKH